MRRNAVVMTLLLGLTVGAGEALAQACTGVPVGSGQFGIGAGMSFTDGAKSYGVNGQANLVGPIAVGAGLAIVDYDDFDTNGTTFGGSVAYKLPLVGVSVCPIAGLSLNRISEEADGVEATVSATAIPLGVGFGISLPAGPAFSLVPYAVPQFLHIRNKVELSGAGGSSISVSDNANEFGALLGLVLDARRLFVGGDVSVTTIEDADPVFSVRVGVKFP